MSSAGSISRRNLLKSAAIGSGALLLGKRGVATASPDSTRIRSYVLPSRPGVHIKPILTTGDAVNGYHMCGIPDGLGALDRGGTFELYVNHEITIGAPGIVRAHGSNGAFV